MSESDPRFEKIEDEINAVQRRLKMMADRVVIEELGGRIAESNQRSVELTEQLSELQRQVALNDREIDVLQVQARQRSQPWYRQTSNLVAVIALLFSFSTTAVSYYRVAQQNIEASRSELRLLLQRLMALPREEMKIREESGPEMAEYAAGLLAMEKHLLANQALQILDNIPDHITSVEYSAVAEALSGTGKFATIAELNGLALEKAKGLDDRIAALRATGDSLYRFGRPADGGDHYRRALEVWEGYQPVTKEYRNSMNLETRVQWANAAFSTGHCEEGFKQLQAAERIATEISPEAVGVVERMQTAAEVCR